MPFSGKGQRRDRNGRAEVDFVAAHARMHWVARGRIAVTAGFQRQCQDLGTVMVYRHPDQRAVLFAATADQRAVSRQGLADNFRTSLGSVAEKRLELDLHWILD